MLVLGLIAGCAGALRVARRTPSMEVVRKKKGGQPISEDEKDRRDAACQEGRAGRREQDGEEHHADSFRDLSLCSQMPTPMKLAVWTALSSHATRG